MTDLLAGQIDGVVDNPPTVLPHIEGGKLRPLAVAAKQRMALLPDLPTAAEAGVANYEASSWFGVVAPAGTPPAIVARLHKAIAAALRQPAVRERFAKTGARLLGNSPDEFAQQIKADRKMWGEIIRAADIKAQSSIDDLVKNRLLSGSSAFARRRGVDGERVHAAGELIRKNPVDHAVAFEPGLTFEGLRHDIDPEMGLPARPVAGMAFVLVGFVLHLEALRRESLGQLLCDEIGGSHAVPLAHDPEKWKPVFGQDHAQKRGWLAGQWLLCGGIKGMMHHCQVLKASPAKAHSVRS